MAYNVLYFVFQYVYCEFPAQAFLGFAPHYSCSEHTIRKIQMKQMNISRGFFHVKPFCFC